MNQYDEIDENYDASQSPTCDARSDSDYEFEMTSRNQYYGRWAAEWWLLLRYFRRCRRFLMAMIGRVKPVSGTSHGSHELPF